MKTTIRTYHPIPALQRTNGNLQDAPRIKHILKACTLDDGDNRNPPSTPSDILARAVSNLFASFPSINIKPLFAESRADPFNHRDEFNIRDGQPLRRKCVAVFWKHRNLTLLSHSDKLTSRMTSNSWMFSSPRKYPQLLEPARFSGCAITI